MTRVDAGRSAGKLACPGLQLAPLNLVRCRQRQGIDECDVTGRLEVGEFAQRVRDDVCRRFNHVADRLARDDAGQDFLATHVIGNRGTRQLAYQTVLPQHALHLGCRDVLAAAADHVLPAIDKEQIAVRVTSHDIAGVEPAILPCGLRRFKVAEVFGEDSGAWIGTGCPHQQFTGRIVRRLLAGLIDDAVSMNGWARPKQDRPIRRGSSLAITTAAAPVSVIAQASIIGMPKRSSNAAWYRGSVPGAKPNRTACSRSSGDDCSPSSMVGITPRLCMIVASLSRTVRHQLRGWNRSSGMMQPPLSIIPRVEQAIAFMCVMGSGVISRSSPGRRVHSPPISVYQRPQRRK